MEKAVVMGCACVVISSLTPDEIDRVKRYDPEALELKKDGETVFFIQIDEGPGSVLNDSAIYSRTTSADGKATITILMDPQVEDKEKMIQKEIGASLLKLDELEKQIMSKTEHLHKMESAAGALISQL